MRLLLLVWCALAAQSPAFASNENQNVVGSAPWLLIPSEDNHKVGEEFTLTEKTENDILARYSVRRVPSAKLSAARDFAIADQKFNITPDSPLNLMFADSRMNGMIAPKSRIFCTSGKEPFMHWFLPLASRFGADLRFCLADQDNDKKIDSMFLAGAKKPEDRKVLPVDPLSYELIDAPVDTKESIVFRFNGYAVFGNDAGFNTELIKDGKPQSNLGFYLDYGNGYVTLTYASMSKPKFPPPYDFRVGSAVFTVLKVDKPMKSITLKLKYKPGPMRAFVTTIETRWLPPFGYPPSKPVPSK